MTISSQRRELEVSEDKFDIQPEMSQTFECLWMEIFAEKNFSKAM